MTESSKTGGSEPSTATLGKLLYSGATRPVVPEASWNAIARAAGRGDPEALFTLYDWTHRLVFTAALRITGSRETAEELTLDLFHSIWQRTTVYNDASTIVLGWIMKEARSRALARLQDALLKRCAGKPQDEADHEFAAQALQLRLAGDRIRELLNLLTPGERRAIEHTFFAEKSYIEAARGRDEPCALLKLRIRSALEAASCLMSSAEPRLAPPESRIRCVQTELVHVYALGALPCDEAAGIEAHIEACLACQQEVRRLRQVISTFAAWPADVLRPDLSLRKQLARRIAEDAGVASFEEPSRIKLAAEWERVGPGIWCRILATDAANDRVGMLVRLAPGAAYPPHTHVGQEELHLLHGELWIEDRKLFPGDYNCATPGSSDSIVRSETGCTCVLITSTRDLLH